MVGKTNLVSFNENNNGQAKLTALQYGFCVGVSTETTLHEFVRRVEHSPVRKKPTRLQMLADQTTKFI